MRRLWRKCYTNPNYRRASKPRRVTPTAKCVWGTKAGRKCRAVSEPTIGSPRETLCAACAITVRSGAAANNMEATTTRPADERQELPPLPAPICYAMSAKDYCSKVCGAKCCRAHDPIISPSKCPMLTAENLCSIYNRRIGFEFDGLTKAGEIITCRCSRPERFLKTLSPEVVAQCCIAHPELLHND